jgi:hypothetical protein
MNYSKFIDATGSMSFQLRFLANATGENTLEANIRRFFNYILIEPSDKGYGQLLGIATDGRHLHLVDPILEADVKEFGLTTGYWQVFKTNSTKRMWIARLEDNEAEKLGTYPNWRRCIPTGEVVYRTKFDGFPIKGLKRSYGRLAKFLHDFPDVTAFDFDYLESLGNNFEWEVEWYGNDKPVKFTERNRIAVIMPMQGL